MSDICAVSKCLLGECCRYDGRLLSTDFKRENPPWGDRILMGVCPEIAGGLKIPRSPCEISGGSGEDVLARRAFVISEDGCDLTSEYLRGAYICAEECMRHGVKIAYLKSKSPSCGVGRIYDGTHSRILTYGDGVFTALLKLLGIDVIQVDV